MTLWICNAGLRVADPALLGLYVDPGAGLFLFQIAGSMLAGAAFMVRRRIARLLAEFRRWICG